MVYVFEDTLSVVSQKPAVMKRSYSMENLKNICPPKSLDVVVFPQAPFRATNVPGQSLDVPMDVTMDVAMANLNISQNNSVAVQEKGFKRSPQMKRINWYQNQGPRKLQKESRVYMRVN